MKTFGARGAAVAVTLIMWSCGSTDESPASATSSTLDAGDWWAVDAGRSTESDVGSGADTGGADVDQKCFDACIAKGASTASCNKACASGGGGKTSVDYDTCYSGCLAKGQSEALCSEGCKCLVACVSKGGASDACVAPCFSSAGPETGKVAQPCYDDCIKKGGSKAACTKACPADPAASFAQPCYNDCVKKGETKEACAKACPAEQIESTWASIHANIIKPKCSNAYCHGGGAGGLSLSADPMSDYQALMQGEAKKATDCTASSYVVAGKASESLLWLKVDAQAAHGCGDKMPQGAGGLAPAQSKLIQQWIDAGAQP